jgi:hypothetical protein
MVRYSLSSACDLSSFNGNSNLINTENNSHFNSPVEPMPTEPPIPSNGEITRPLNESNPNMNYKALEKVEDNEYSNDTSQVFYDSRKKDHEPPFQNMNRDTQILDKLPKTMRGLADNEMIRSRRKESFVKDQKKDSNSDEATHEEPTPVVATLDIENRSIYVTFLSIAIIFVCVYFIKKAFN